MLFLFFLRKEKQIIIAAVCAITNWHRVFIANTKQLICCRSRDFIIRSWKTGFTWMWNKKCSTNIGTRWLGVQMASHNEHNRLWQISGLGRRSSIPHLEGGGPWDRPSLCSSRYWCGRWHNAVKPPLCVWHKCFEKHVPSSSPVEVVQNF